MTIAAAMYLQLMSHEIAHQWWGNMVSIGDTNSVTLSEGLAEFYGLTSFDATVYLKHHTEADLRHTKTWKNAIDSSSNDDQTIIRAAENSLTCQNLLLDGCFETYC